MRIHIKHGRLVDPKNQIDATRDLFVAEGRVAGVGASPAGFHADRVIDAAGLTVAPGLVDLAARLREPGLEYKATLDDPDTGVSTPNPETRTQFANRILTQIAFKDPVRAWEKMQAERTALATVVITDIDVT